MTPTKASRTFSVASTRRTVFTLCFVRPGEPATDRDVDDEPGEEYHVARIQVHSKAFALAASFATVGAPRKVTRALTVFSKSDVRELRLVLLGLAEPVHLAAVDREVVHVGFQAGEQLLGGGVQGLRQKADAVRARGAHTRVGERLVSGQGGELGPGPKKRLDLVAERLLQVSLDLSFRAMAAFPDRAEKITFPLAMNVSTSVKPSSSNSSRSRAIVTV